MTSSGDPRRWQDPGTGLASFSDEFHDRRDVLRALDWLERRLVSDEAR